MLHALDAETDAIVAGDEAVKKRRYLCPECRALVGLRTGMKKIPHFAHHSFSRCALAEPESPRHRALKWMCKTFFAPLPVVWEAPIGPRRADVVVDGRLVVECQSSPLSVALWRDRTASHNRSGYPVLWLWDVKRLCRKNTLEEALALERSRRIVPVPPEIRLCHDESAGVVYVADKHTVLPCRLTPLSAAEQAASRAGGSPAMMFWPQALRRVSFGKDIDGRAWGPVYERSDALTLVHFEGAGATTV